MKRDLKGAAKTTHALKEYGYGKSMKAGLERLASEKKKEGVYEFIQHLRENLEALGNVFTSQKKNKSR